MGAAEGSFLANFEGLVTIWWPKCRPCVRICTLIGLNQLEMIQQVLGSVNAEYFDIQWYVRGSQGLLCLPIKFYPPETSSPQTVLSGPMRLSRERGQNWHMLPLYTSYNMHKSNKNTILTQPSGRIQSIFVMITSHFEWRFFVRARNILLRMIGSCLPIKM